LKIFDKKIRNKVDTKLIVKILIVVVTVILIAVILRKELWGLVIKFFPFLSRKAEETEKEEQLADENVDWEGTRLPKIPKVPKLLSFEILSCPPYPEQPPDPKYVLGDTGDISFGNLEKDIEPKKLKKLDEARQRFMDRRTEWWKVVNEWGKKQFHALLLLSLGAFIFLVMAGWLVPVEIFGVKSNLGIIFGLLFFLSLISPLNWEIVRSEEIGMKSIFGRMLYTVNSGLSFVPIWLNTRIQKVNRDYRFIKMPGCHQKEILNGDKKTTVAVLDNVTFLGKGNGNEEGSTDREILSLRAVAGITTEPIFRIRERTFGDFIMYLRTPEEGAVQIGAFLENILKGFASRMTIEEFQRNLSKLTWHVEKLLDFQVFIYGVDTKVPIHGVLIDGDLKIAVNSVPAAMGASKVIRINADANLEKRKKEAEGEGTFERETREGIAAGMEELRKVLDRQGGHVVANVEIGRLLAQKTENTLVMSGGKNGEGLDTLANIVIGAGFAAKETLKGKDESDKKEGKEADPNNTERTGKS